MYQRFFILLLAMSYSCVLLADTALIVVPSGFEDTEGNTNIQHMTRDAPRREQQIYDAADFEPAPMTIIGYRLRPDGIKQTLPATINYTGVEIYLSTTSAAAPISMTYADNTGPDETLVYSGNLTLSTNPTDPGVGPNAFDMMVDFQTPFNYDPSQGNLLVDFTATGIVGDVRFDAVWIFPSLTRIIWSDPNFEVPIYASGYVFARQFVLVPEPATCFHMVVGLMGLIGYRWRRRKHAI